MIEPVAIGARSIQYPISFTLAALLALVVLQPWTYAQTYVFASGNDAVWQQAVIQMHGQVGVFGTTPHLAWPVGANPWRLPQLGPLIGAWARITVGWLGLGTAASIMWLLVVTAGLNAVAILFFLRSVVGHRLLVLAQVVAVTLAASTFTLDHQLNLAMFFAVPVTFGALLRVTHCGRRQLLTAGLGVATVGFLSPLWWIVVLLLMLPFMALSPIVRAHWQSVERLVVVWGALTIGLGVQTLAFLIASRGGPGADTQRDAWASNSFPGSLVSLMVSSPWLNELFPTLTARLRPGAGATTAVGLPMAVLAALSFTVVLAIPPRRRPTDTVSLLGSATVVSVLFWLGGGLANLQAAVAVIGQTASPARVWYRMAVVMGVLGGAWLVWAFRHIRWLARPRWPAVVVVGPLIASSVLLLGGLGDLATRTGRYGYTPPTAAQPALPGVAFISNSLDPCPVAQFPNEAVPVSRIPPSGILDPRLYRGWVPYIIEPDFFWTAGVYDPNDPTSGLGALPVVLDNAVLAQLRADGYCALVFDKTVSERAIETSTLIEGRELGSLPRPDFEDDRFAIYLLDR
jgi:hypothetical protein